eukprot:1157356-Pelagomonas_calceolata.AAC.6
MVHAFATQSNNDTVKGGPAAGTTFSAAVLPSWHVHYRAQGQCMQSIIVEKESRHGDMTASAIGTSQAHPPTHTRESARIRMTACVHRNLCLPILKSLFTSSCTTPDALAHTKINYKLCQPATWNLFNLGAQEESSNQFPRVHQEGAGSLDFQGQPSHPIALKLPHESTRCCRNNPFFIHARTSANTGEATRRPPRKAGASRPSWKKLRLKSPCVKVAGTAFQRSCPSSEQGDVAAADDDDADAAVEANCVPLILHTWIPVPCGDAPVLAEPFTPLLAIRPVI